MLCKLTSTLMTCWMSKVRGGRLGAASVCGRVKMRERGGEGGREGEKERERESCLREKEKRPPVNHIQTFPRVCTQAGALGEEGSSSLRAQALHPAALAAAIAGKSRGVCTCCPAQGVKERERVCVFAPAPCRVNVLREKQGELIEPGAGAGRVCVTRAVQLGWVCVRRGVREQGSRIRCVQCIWNMLNHGRLDRLRRLPRRQNSRTTPSRASSGSFLRRRVSARTHTRAHTHTHSRTHTHTHGWRLICANWLVLAWGPGAPQQMSLMKFGVVLFYRSTRRWMTVRVSSG